MSMVLTSLSEAATRSRRVAQSYPRFCFPRAAPGAWRTDTNAMSRPSRRSCWATARVAIDVDPVVRKALQKGRPVVALESTIISHGMPFPENLEMARDVESIVKDKGAVPATVAILGGRPLVGLSSRQLEMLATAGPRARKCSRRDIAVAIAQGVDGATTAASTAYLAALAGIRVFVTGGMGGVHRGAETTFDVSADLSELAHTPIVVVCAGVKSILDVEKTLEVLETNGVPVISYGTDDFPAFFSPKSGIPSPLRLDTAADVAAAAKAGFDLGMRNGMVVAVPNPSPTDGGAGVDAAIRLALEEASSKGLTGRDVTPFVLSKVNEETGGESLKSNIALVRHNATVGADIATQLAALEHRATNDVRTVHHSSPSSRRSRRRTFDPKQDLTLNAPRVVVFGGAVVDIVARPYPGSRLTPATSTPGEARQSFGGVGRNVAEGLARVLGGTSRAGANADEKVAETRSEVFLVSAVGADDAGRSLVAGLEEIGVSARGRMHVERGEGKHEKGRETFRTASYIAMLGGDGDLVAAVADMRVFESMDAEFVDRHADVIADARVIVSDGNFPPQGFARLAELCTQEGVPLVFEPTSVAKCTLPFAIRGAVSGVALVTPNLDELAAIAAVITALQQLSVPGDGTIGDDARHPGLSDVSLISSPSSMTHTSEDTGQRVGQSLAQGAISADGSFTDAKPIGPALKAVLTAMLTNDSTCGVEAEGSTCASVSGTNGVHLSRRDRSLPEPVLLDGAKHVAVTMGSAGVLFASARPASKIERTGGDASNPHGDAVEEMLVEIPVSSGKWFAFSAYHYPALPLPPRSAVGQGEVVNCTGAGDCLVAGMVSGLALGWEAKESVLLGLVCARESVQVDKAVPESLGNLLHKQREPETKERHFNALTGLLPEGYTPRAVDPWR